MLKDSFKGTGTLKKFVDESNSAFSALNDIKVYMPQGYAGAEPTMQLSGDNKSIVFDMGDALIFTLNNVVWNFTGSADIDTMSAEVLNGKLVINVEANDS